MTNNTIPNVPRELLERAVRIPTKASVEENHAAIVDRGRAQSELRALLSANSPAGVDGLEVVGWYTEDYLDDKSATTYSREVADRWLAKGWPVTGIANAADAQTIIDGLRGEVAQLQSMLATVSKAGIRVRTDRDQQAQRIGELERALLEVAASLAWNAHGECRAIHDGPIMPSKMAIDAAKAALSAGVGRVK